MSNQSKSGSSALVGAGMLCFAAGGLSFLAVKSVAIAAGLTAVGGALLIGNALLHPNSIKIPDVPEINVPTPTVRVNL